MNPELAKAIANGQGLFDRDPPVDVAARAQSRRKASSLETIPAEFRWATLNAPAIRDRVANPAALTLAPAARDSRRVVFVGPSGAGKTSLAAAIFRARVEAVPEASAVFTPVWRLTMARARSEDSDPELLARCKRCDLLILDDLAERQTVPSDPVPDLIRERHAEAKATWVTTYMSLEQVAARYGDDIARRIFQRSLLIDCGAQR